MKNKIENAPVLCAAVYLLIWESLTALIWLFSAKLFVVYIAFALGFTLVYPIITCWCCFRYTRLFGVKWYLPAVMTAASVIEYIFISDMKAVVPNFILLTVLCVLFATGIGNVFTIGKADKKSSRTDKKSKKEQEYKKILDD